MSNSINNEDAFDKALRGSKEYLQEQCYRYPKTVILRNKELGGIELVIIVENWDENFKSLIESANKHWNETGVDWLNCLFNFLSNSDYKFKVNVEMETIDINFNFINR